MKQKWLVPDDYIIIKEVAGKHENSCLFGVFLSSKFGSLLDVLRCRLLDVFWLPLLDWFSTIFMPAYMNLCFLHFHQKYWMYTLIYYNNINKIMTSGPLSPENTMPWAGQPPISAAKRLVCWHNQSEPVHRPRDGYNQSDVARNRMIFECKGSSFFASNGYYRRCARLLKFYTNMEWHLSLQLWNVAGK